MDPSSPPVKRTLHLLKTPDILLANDSGKIVLYHFVIAGLATMRPERERHALLNHQASNYWKTGAGGCKDEFPGDLVRVGAGTIWQRRPVVGLM
jgi:hypothetical protein